ncbi:MAG: hypothetical protein L3J34_07055 [Flavobacteriaceae bacterium]|nr:hypothetical protein [Flavobacteriaceae bacterium]
MVVFVSIALSINAIISKVITTKINELVLNNSFKLHTAKVENVKFNLFERSVTANNLFLTPTKESISKLKGQSLKNKELEKISISSIKFKGIHLTKILFYNDIHINTLLVDNLLFQDFINPKIKDKPDQKKPFNLDSIAIRKIKGLQIDKIKFNNFNFQQIDINSKELLFHHEPFNLIIDGFILKNIGDQVFKLMPIKNVFEIHDVEIKLPKKGYNLQIASIKLDFNKAVIAVEKFKYKPLIDKRTLANSYKFSKAVFDTEIDKIFIYNFQLKEMLKKQGVFIDSIEVIDLGLEVYKDKRKPFDESMRPKDPHVLLKEMKSPLHIQKIKVKNGSILFEAQLEKNDLLMTLNLNNVNANINNITSIKKYRENPLEVDFRSDLMNRSKMHINIIFPLKDFNNSFKFYGTLGPAKLKYFDSALYPTLGLKVLQGELDGLKFDAVAHSNSSEGKMTMLYHNLKAEVFKSHSLEENKFLSWVVKGATYKSNPKKHKPPKEVVLHADRVIYKGFINYIWKTLQSGIIATITPIGTTTKKAEKKKLKKEKREKRRNHN